MPWLAAAGELAYTPHSPPERDYYFQCSWIICRNLQLWCGECAATLWFGSLWKDGPEVKLISTLEAEPEGARSMRLFLSNGGAESGGCDGAARSLPSPRSESLDRRKYDRHAAWKLSDRCTGIPSLSYDQRRSGSLSRCPESKSIHRLPKKLTSPDTRSRLMTVHSRNLEDSVTSFNGAHCNVSRTETGYFKDRSFVLGKLCETAGLELKPSITRLLYSGYSLEEWCASRKFGPNYVKLRTPLTNLRITTFVCNEAEVKVIDPNKLDVLECVGCRVRETHV